MNDDIKKRRSSYKYKNRYENLKNSKRKARMKNTFTLICLLFIFVSSIITIRFCGYGDPDKFRVYRDVVDSAIAVTHPNIIIKSSSVQGESYFTTTFKGKLEKQVGGKHISAGEVNLKFFLNNASSGGVKLSLSKNFNSLFCYPSSLKEVTTKTHWERLEKLPEGTVAEAYIYLDKFYETDEILKKFKDKEIDPLWFAVDTEFNGKDVHDGYISNPIGFPYSPVWHHDDWILNRTEKKCKFGTIISESGRTPSLDAYGSGDIRNENFIKTLKLMKEYESIAKGLSFSARELEKKIDYINENGVKIYGVVITGPTKEILKLMDEEWVKGIEVGEVITK